MASAPCDGDHTSPPPQVDGGVHRLHTRVRQKREFIHSLVRFRFRQVVEIVTDWDRKSMPAVLPAPASSARKDSVVSP
jgi:hypothetical protein